MPLGLSPAEIEAIRLSLLVAATAVVASLPVGLALGWIMARRTFWGKGVLDTLINLPLVLPPVVTGFLLLVLFGRNGWLGAVLEERLGVRLIFDWKGAALAAAVVSFPLMARSIRTAFAEVDERLELTARTLGAGRLATFARVTLPLARRGIIAGCVLAFARSMGEFGATIMIAGSIPGETRTIPLHIFSLLETPGGLDHATRIVLVAVVIAGAALIAGERLEQGHRTRRTTAQG